MLLPEITNAIMGHHLSYSKWIFIASAVKVSSEELIHHTTITCKNQFTTFDT